MTMINAFDPTKAQNLTAEDAALFARRRAALGPSYRLFYQEPVHVVRGSGVYLYDAQGHEYLDCYNNVASVGHCHPHVVAAIAKQAGILNTHTRYLTDDVVVYAERLLKTMPSEIGHVMFTCTGSEANDLALRIARRHTGAEGVIVTKLAYHGVTEAIAEISPSLGPGVPLGHRVVKVDAPRSLTIEKDVAAKFADAVRHAISGLATKGMKPAALIVDTIFSSDGVFSDPKGFLAPAIDVIRKAGGVFIADEVQPGFGRTGQGMWGFARHGLVPDIITMGKPMGGGHPVAAMACKPEIIARFGNEARYFNTFGGNPVSIAAASAVLDVIEGEHLIANAKSTGDILLQGLLDLQKRDERIGDVRGCGLFVGAALVKDTSHHTPDGDLATKVVNSLRQKRVLISACGEGANVLKIRPPLPFGPKHADHFLTTLSSVLKDTP
jgi:4-aminobutyrate aminotransferase-like enzyme